MADFIQCPSCGRENSPDLEFCQYCQTRLQPLTGTLKDEDKPIKPGQVPTKKNTAELEPILPQWLKDARDSARTDEGQHSSEQPPQKPQDPLQKSAPAGDFLSGLQSQTGDDEEDEIPDWLASITGDTSKPKEPQADSPEVRWVEMGSREDFAQDEPAKEDEAPPWLAGLQPPEPQQDELTDRLRGAAEEEQPEPAQTFDTPAPETPAEDAPDWLRQMAMDAEEKSADLQADVYQDAPELPLDTPDWLRTLGGAEADQPADAGPAGFSEPSPAEPEVGVTSEAPDLSSLEIPDWMKGESESGKPIQDTTPPWLKKEAGESSEPEAPAWLSGMDAFQASPEPPAETPAPDFESANVPDWLKAAAPQSSIFEEEEKPAAEPEPVETPDWLSSFKPVEAEMPPAEQEAPFETPPTPAAETPETGNLDELFTEMPDWLSSAMEPPPSSAPTPITHEDALAPSELPSWVQAMRPVEPGVSRAASLSSDQTLESRGALAGLQGVLPAVPGYMPTSKPKPYSIKLQASDEQLAHAEILEQILAAETAPVPLESFSTLRASRGLRWLIASLLVLAVLVTVSMRTRLFSMPVGAPNEVRDAISAAQAIPENAPILVAVDYEPSRAGEMEAAAAPMLDHLMLLKAPRLTFIATNETGAILAERLLSGPLAGHNYQSRAAYLNLGYLPGGQLGIRAFAQNPMSTTPLDMSLQPAWTTPPLEGVTALDQFAAMILLTDNAEAARIWVEQTQTLRGGIPFIIVSSAQAAPMIQPYYNSAQVTGIIPGLYGGAIFEQYNAGRPGTARAYWDAYSLGMLLAMSLTLGGGLWNLALGMRERAAAGEGK